MVVTIRIRDSIGSHNVDRGHGVTPGIQVIGAKSTLRARFIKLANAERIYLYIRRLADFLVRKLSFRALTMARCRATVPGDAPEFGANVILCAGSLEFS